jgi:centrosomal protein CEP104
VYAREINLLLCAFYRVVAGEIARSVERVLPELLSKSGDSTPRIHNMAVQTILDIADCPDVRCVVIVLN